MLGFNTIGRLEKLTIEAYMDANYRERVNVFTVPLNPAKYTKSYGVQSATISGIVNPGKETYFEGIRPEGLDMEFMIDGSGALGEQYFVDEKISEFMDTVYKYEGEIHSPKYLKLIWGTELFNCTITSVDIEYLMFRPEGTPIRANIKAKFQEYIQHEEWEYTVKRSSPDLTHQRVIEEGDNLVSMTYKIYKSIAPLIQVAQANDLDSLRGTHTGDKLFFPPIES